MSVRILFGLLTSDKFKMLGNTPRRRIPRASFGGFLTETPTQHTENNEEKRRSFEEWLKISADNV
jgi:hypothetical protein